MSLLTELTKKWSYSVKNPGAGRLLYREGNREYTFPFYEEAGGWVLAAVPSGQRIHLFFTWITQEPEFSEATRERILPRIAAQLRSWSVTVRIFEQGGPTGADFEFYPELFEQRGLATEWLEAEGFSCFADYSSIDLLHGEYGLEICGIKNQRDAGLIAEIMRRGFPQWHHQHICHQDHGCEPGWTLALCLFPARSGNPEWQDDF